MIIGLARTLEGDAHAARSGWWETPAAGSCCPRSPPNCHRRFLRRRRRGRSARPMSRAWPDAARPRCRQCRRRARSHRCVPCFPYSPAPAAFYMECGGRLRYDRRATVLPENAPSMPILTVACGPRWRGSAGKARARWPLRSFSAFRRSPACGLRQAVPRRDRCSSCCCFLICAPTRPPSAAIFKRPA